MEGLVVHFIGYFSASKQEFHVRRKSVRGSWCPPWPSAVKQRIAAFVVLRKCHNKAAIHFDNDLQTWTSPSLQIVVEVNGCLVMAFPKYNESGDSLFYGAGPRWTPRASHRLSPYMEFLFGGRKVTYEVD